MDNHELGKSTCRICLRENAEQDWNGFLKHQHITYKDCYCKFTGLECFDEENFSTVLCRNCSICLENINIFISKAIENHYLLLEKLPLNLLQKSDDGIQHETKLDTSLTEEEDIKTTIYGLTTFREDPNNDNETCSLPETISNDLIQSTSQQQPEKVKKPSFGPLPKYEKSSKKETKQSRKIPKKNSYSLPQLISQRKTKQKKVKNTNPSDQQLNDEIAVKKKSVKSGKVPTSCSICSKVLLSKYAAINHEKTHHTNRERSVACSQCGLKFYCKITLKNHQEVHLENRTTYKCEFCEKSFFRKYSLNIHRRIHLGQLIPCPLCSKEYYRQIDLDKHMISHPAAKINDSVVTKKKILVRCKFCGENIRSLNYKSHFAKHMNNPLCKCSICDKEFFSRESCFSHLRKFHKKGNGEKGNFVIELKNNFRCTSLFMQQNASKVFIEE